MSSLRVTASRTEDKIDGVHTRLDTLTTVLDDRTETVVRGIDAVLTSVHASKVDLQRQLQAQSKLITEWVDTAFPRKVALVPDADGGRELARSLKDKTSRWKKDKEARLGLFKHFRLVVVCECRGATSTECAPHKGYAVKTPGDTLVKALPALQLGLKMVRGCAKLGSLAGLPIPSLPASDPTWGEEAQAQLDTIAAELMTEGMDGRLYGNAYQALAELLSKQEFGGWPGGTAAIVMRSFVCLLASSVGLAEADPPPPSSS